MERSEYADSLMKEATGSGLGEAFTDILGRTLDLLVIFNPAEVSVLDVLPNLGAFTRPRRALVVAGHLSTFAIGVTIGYVKWKELITEGQMYLAVATAVGGS